MNDDALLGIVVENLASELRRNRGPSDFSPQSLALLLQRQAEFVEDVGTRAVRMARREQSDVVSASHVDRAVAELSAGGQGARVAALQAVGGSALGAGGGQLFSVLTSPSPSPVAYLLAVFGLLLGTVIIFVGFGRRR